MISNFLAPHVAALFGISAEAAEAGMTGFFVGIVASYLFRRLDKMLGLPKSTNNP